MTLHKRKWNCSKVYHLECVGYDDETTSEIEDNWTCDCHSCSSCEGAFEVQCLCCPTSFCKNCIQSIKFVALRPNKGLCTHCWTLVLLKNSHFSRNLWIWKIEIHTSVCSKSIGKFKIVKEEEGLSRDDLVAVEEDSELQTHASTMTVLCGKFFSSSIDFHLGLDI